MESNINEYQLKQGDNIYIFSTCLVNNTIRLSCDNQKDKKYSRDFSLFELQTLDPFFNAIVSEQNAIDFIDKALNVHKVAVIEETGILKIIFYVTQKGLIKTVEIPLYQLGKNALQSNLDNLNTKENSSTQIKAETTNDFSNNVQQTYENTNINTSEVGVYDSSSLNNIGDNFNINEFISQTQATTSIGATTTYDNTFSTNYEDYQNYNNYQTDNNQYIQSEYDTSNNVEGANGLTSNVDQVYENEAIMGKSSSNEFNINVDSYDYNLVGNISNQYTTSSDTYNYDYSNTNDYKTSSYEIPSNAIGTTEFNGTYSYENTNTNYQYNEYTQPSIQSTNNNGQVFSSAYGDTSLSSPVSEPLPSTKTDNSVQINSLQWEYVPNKYATQTFAQPTNVFNEYKTSLDDKPKYNTNTEYQLTQTRYIPDSTIDNRQSIQSHEERINKLEGDTQELKNETQELQNKLINLTGKLEKQNNASESNNPNTQAEENQSLKKQIEELSSLKKQIEEMEALKSQLLELNSLREKVAELSLAQSQLDEIKSLREQVAEVDTLKKQLEELKELKNKRKSEDKEILKKKIEELEKSNLEYEKEINLLKNSQPSAQSLKPSTKIGLETKDVIQEDKEEDEIDCVKGDIIHDANELELVTRKINKLNKKLTLNLLYKASADSDKAVAFHSKCDDAKSTIVLVETDKGKRFGGFTTCSWSGDCLDKKDEDAFVFSLDKMKTYDNIPGENAIGCYPKYGPVFLGCQIRIFDNAFIKGGTTFERALNFNTEEDFELTGGERTFKIKDIEVYEVISQ